jgi:hypothetical protein
LRAGCLGTACQQEKQEQAHYRFIQKASLHIFLQFYSYESQVCLKSLEIIFATNETLNPGKFGLQYAWADI